MFLVQLIIFQIIIFAALIFALRHILTKNITSATSHLDGLNAEFICREEEVKKRQVEAEKLYECLERHLGICFEREALVEPQPPVNNTMVGIHLPEELSARLMVAAELHSTTALKACLQELRSGGPETERLAEEIRQLMRSYDMDGIQRLLTRVTAQSVKA